MGRSGRYPGVMRVVQQRRAVSACACNCLAWNAKLLKVPDDSRATSSHEGCRPFLHTAATPETRPISMTANLVEATFNSEVICTGGQAL